MEGELYFEILKKLNHLTLLIFSFVLKLNKAKIFLNNMPLPKRKILLVEDNPDQAEIYVMELKTAGYEVIHTLDATEAPILAEREKPDLILLDLMLGNLSGLDILKQIKENRATKNIKVVALTNFREKELLEDERLKGVYDYIYKPEFTPRELVRKIREYLE